jgi:hypothetical protein
MNRYIKIINAIDDSTYHNKQECLQHLEAIRMQIIELLMRCAMTKLIIF